MPTYCRPEHTEAENRVRQQLEERWRCTLHRYPYLHEVDWYAERDGRIVAYLELKCRTHRHSDYPTIYLSVNKYLTLAKLEDRGVPAFFVVQFTDSLRYIRIGQIAQVRMTRAGRRDRGGLNDLEPIMEIPVSDLELVSDA